MVKAAAITEFKSYNQQRFVEMGKELYGDMWMLSAAKALDKDHRQIRRWAKGEHEPPDDIVEQLAGMARKRAAQLMRAANRE